MPQVIEGVTYFTQSEVNGLVGTARGEGRQAGEAALLKDIGVESVDVAKNTLKLAGEQGTKITELTGQLDTQKASTTEVTSKFRKLSLERAAEAIGAGLKLVPVKALQVLTLLGVKPEEFDPEKKEDKDSLTAKFDTFLKAPENAHFIAASDAHETGRKPGSGAGGEVKNEWSDLRNMVTAAKG